MAFSYLFSYVIRSPPIPLPLVATLSTWMPKRPATPAFGRELGVYARASNPPTAHMQSAMSVRSVVREGIESVSGTRVGVRAYPNRRWFSITLGFRVKG